jgi:hypothetical protein
VPSYLFVEAFSALLPLAMGFAAGCMIWIALADLLPDALDSLDSGTVATVTTVAAAWWVRWIPGWAAECIIIICMLLHVGKQLVHLLFALWWV